MSGGGPEGLTTRSGRRASQRADELGPFIELLQAEGVRRYLEIGARHGDTFFEVMRALPAGAKGVAVDLPGGAWGIRSSRAALDGAIAELRELGYDASAIYGDSQSAGVQQMVRCRGPYDAVLIDGDHRLAGVMADWAAFGKLAPLVAFHDIAGEDATAGDGTPVEVPLAWQSIKRERRHVEIVGAARGFGIGVVWP
jgi:hypothetical protein